jgi:hypothetical protein
MAETILVTGATGNVGSEVEPNLQALPQMLMLRPQYSRFKNKKCDSANAIIALTVLIWLPCQVPVFFFALFTLKSYSITVALYL